MGNIIHTTLTPTIYFEMTEGEAGALDAICGYGHKAFLEHFKEKLGSSYIEPYEQHLESLFKKARYLAGQIREIKKAREYLSQKGITIK